MPGFADPNAVTYSYRVEGSLSNAAWSPWSASMYVPLSNLTPGQYVFQVKARDEAGNESALAERPFVVR